MTLQFLTLEVGMMFLNISPKDRELCKNWASSVPLRALLKEPHPEMEVLAWGLARFFWDGEGSMPAITSLLRQEYPQIRKTLLNVPLTDEIRTIFRSWAAERATALEVRL